MINKRYKVVLIPTKTPTFPCICESTYFLKNKVIGRRDYQVVNSVIRGSANYYHLAIVDTQAPVLEGDIVHTVESKSDDKSLTLHKIVACSDHSIDVIPLEESMLQCYVEHRFDYLDPEKFNLTIKALFRLDKPFEIGDWIVAKHDLGDYYGGIVFKKGYKQQIKNNILGLVGKTEDFDWELTTPQSSKARRKALKWWNSLPTSNCTKQSLYSVYYEDRDGDSLTGREIEYIYNNEMKLLEFSNSMSNDSYEKFDSSIEGIQRLSPNIAVRMTSSDSFELRIDCKKFFDDVSSYQIETIMNNHDKFLQLITDVNTSKELWIVTNCLDTI